MRSQSNSLFLKKTIPILITLTFVGCLATFSYAGVTIEKGKDEGMECFVIHTDSATYYYQKSAGGFSSILDRDGNDWLSYRKSEQEQYPDSAASDYRGLPNMVFKSDDGGAGHPGFEKCVSFQTGPNSIRSLSKSGNWSWSWEFTDQHATLTVEESDPNHAYWFLYEGPIAGTFDPDNQYWGNSREGPIQTFDDYVKGETTKNIWNWAYFGSHAINRIFVVQHLTPDALPDMCGYMGNTRQGLASDDGMIAFGFGRYITADPLMTRTPNQFRIHFKEFKIDSIEAHQQLGNELSQD